jgi:hypothetical protein
MSTFRKGDVVSITGTIDSEWMHDGQIKVRVEPYHDIFVPVADLKMVKPVINVGDHVAYPGYRDGEVLAIVDGWCWVSVSLGGGLGSERASWPLSCISRVDPEPAPADAERIDAPPPFEATIGLDTAEAEPF